MIRERTRLCESTWWTIIIPDEWSCYRDANSVSIHAEPALGVLQVSAARKDADLVTDDDLRDFAQDHVRTYGDLSPVAIGEWCGFYLKFSTDEYYWREWWLRNKNLLVYVTYNIDLAKKGCEDQEVDKILLSLKAKDN